MKVHSKLSHLVALSSILIGFYLSYLPEQIGFFRLLSILTPEFIGLFPAFHRGIPWRYSHEMLYETCSTNDDNSIKGENAIVTGANSGIGFEISKALAKCGAHVTMVCRNPTKCQLAAQQIQQDIQNESNDTNDPLPDIHTMTADVSSLKSVQSFALSYLEKHPPKEESSLDMLFLNAGIPGRQLTDDFLSEDGFEKVFATNYLGHHLLYRLLEPLILQSKMARIVQTSSAASFHTFPFKVATSLSQLNQQSTRPTSLKYYGQSKLAQIVWTHQLTKLLAQKSLHHVYVNAVHPGAVYTPIASKFFSNFFPPWVITLINYAAQQLLWSSEDGALTPLYVGVAKQLMKENNVKGSYFHPQGQPVQNTLALEESLQEDLWKFSNDLISSFL